MVIPDGSTVQAARGQTGRGQGNLVAVDGKVLASGDVAVGQGRLRDRTVSRRRGGMDRVRDTRHETAVVTELPGRGMGFLRIDVQNTLNDENGTEMIWAVQHKWPSGAQFTFN